MHKPYKNNTEKIPLSIKGDNFDASDSDASKGLRLVFLTILTITTSSITNAQCAMCRAALESTGDNGMAEGINNGIVFLMAIPYILVAVIGYLIYRLIKKSKKQPA